MELTLVDLKRFVDVGSDEPFVDESLVDRVSNEREERSLLKVVKLREGSKVLEWKRGLTRQS